MRVVTAAGMAVGGVFWGADASAEGIVGSGIEEAGAAGSGEATDVGKVEPAAIGARAQGRPVELAGLTEGHRAEVGIAVIFRDRVYTVGDEVEYPLAGAVSVYAATAALSKMEAEGISPDKSVTVKAKSLRGDGGAMREKYSGGRIRTTYREILEFAVSDGDGNACDLLIDFAGGIGEVDSYIRSLGITGFGLSETDCGSGCDAAGSYGNRSTPSAVAELFRKIYSGAVLSKENKEFLQGLLLGCVTGEEKMKAGLLGETSLAHVSGETGLFDDGAEFEGKDVGGLRAGNCDVGVIHLPNGEKCCIAVMIRNSAESPASDARLMARVANSVFRQIFVWR